MVTKSEIYYRTTSGEALNATTIEYEEVTEDVTQKYMLNMTNHEVQSETVIETVWGLQSIAWPFIISAGYIFAN